MFHIVACIVITVKALTTVETRRVGTVQCPPGFTCFNDARSFVTALNKPAGSTAKLALFCSEASPCTISGVQLGGQIDGVVASVLLQHVVIQDNDAQGSNGALLNIGTGSVVGTHVHFRNGTDAEFGGCVNNHMGTFNCTDCTFEDCALQGDGAGGGVYSGNFGDGRMALVRATFARNTCVSGCDSGWGSGCFCEGDDPYKCAGCICAGGGGTGSFHCDNGEVSPPLPPPPPPPSCDAVDISGNWHVGNRYRLKVTQNKDCTLSVEGAAPFECGTPPLPACRFNWVSPAPGVISGRTPTIFFCDWQDCTVVWPDPNSNQRWALNNGTIAPDGNSITWPHTAAMVGNWTRGLGPTPLPPAPPTPPPGDFPGACCAASAFGCGVAPQKCGPGECIPTPWVNCTDGKPKYCQDCGFPPCPGISC